MVKKARKLKNRRWSKFLREIAYAYVETRYSVRTVPMTVTARVTPKDWAICSPDRIRNR
ncbi:hypothetical protein D3C85_1921590 [compost metagenome]